MSYEVQLHVRIEPALEKALELAQQQTGIDKAMIVRWAVAKYLCEGEDEIIREYAQMVKKEQEANISRDMCRLELRALTHGNNVDKMLARLKKQGFASENMQKVERWVKEEAKVLGSKQEVEKVFSKHKKGLVLCKFKKR